MRSAPVCMDRIILHCDCNGFYASVECALNPELKNIPMAVGGNEKDRHGIILAKNELAKAYNIKTAETIWQAKKKCPNLTVVPPHHDIYSDFSKRINAIYARFTDLVEPFSIDESWLDVTESVNLFGGGKEIADKLRKLVYDETGVTISVGVSFNKIFAKMGSDYKKPNATTVISRENYMDILYPLPADNMIYVGKSTLAKLHSIGVNTIGDIVNLGKDNLTNMFGKAGTELYMNAAGLGDTEVKNIDTHREIKSIGNSTTFRYDLTTFESAVPEIQALSDSIASRMRKSKVKCRGVQVTVKDNEFKVITRQRMLDSPTNLARIISKTALDILKQSRSFKKPVRMLAVTGINIINEEEAHEQISFFENISDEKYENIEKSIDVIRQKYGKDIIKLGGAKTLAEKDNE